MICLKKAKGAPGFEPGPLDLQSNALPLSYTPTAALQEHYAMFVPLALLTSLHEHVSM